MPHRPSAKLLLYRDSNRLEPPGQHHGPRRLLSAVQGPSNGHATSVGPSSGHATSAGPSNDHATSAGPSNDHATSAGPSNDHATSAGRQSEVPTSLHSARLLAEAACISKSTYLDIFLASLKSLGRFYFRCVTVNSQNLQCQV